MGVAKRMYSKVRQGAPWRGRGGIDLLGGVVVRADGTLFMKVSPPKPEKPARTPETLTSAPKEPRKRKPGKLKPKVLV